MFAYSRIILNWDTTRAAILNAITDTTSNATQHDVANFIWRTASTTINESWRGTRNNTITALNNILSSLNE